MSLSHLKPVKASPNLEAVPWIFFMDGLPMMVRVELVQKEEHMSGNHGFYEPKCLKSHGFAVFSVHFLSIFT